MKAEWVCCQKSQKWGGRPCILGDSRLPETHADGVRVCRSHAGRGRMAAKTPSDCWPLATGAAFQRAQGAGHRRGPAEAPCGRVAVVRQAWQARPKAVDIAYQSIHRMGLESPHEPALHRNLCAAGRAAQLPHDGRAPVHHAGGRVQPLRLAGAGIRRAPVRAHAARGDADRRRRQGAPRSALRSQACANSASTASATFSKRASCPALPARLRPTGASPARWMGSDTAQPSKKLISVGLRSIRPLAAK